MVEILGSPIAISCSYDQSYKVEVCLHEQLWGESMTSNDLAIEVMTLISHLEVLCEQEAGEAEKQQRGDRRKMYITQAAMLRDRMEKLINKHPEPRPGSLEEYLSQSGLGTLFPRAAHYIGGGAKGNRHTPKKAPMDGYLSHLATVNQVNTLCKQLNHDVQNLSNHKYIAHQVALLYQSLNQLGNVKALLSYRNNIEGMFKRLKSSLELTGDGDSVPHLPDEYKQWLIQMTLSLQEAVASFNPSFNQPLLPAIGFLQQTH